MGITVGQISAFFLSGLLAALSPCVLPLYPGFMAYLGGQVLGRRRVHVLLGLLTLLGVLTMMLLLGVAVASLRLALGQVLSVAAPLADLVIIVLGTLMLLGINPFARLPQPHLQAVGHPLISAYLYGLLYGPVALPCSGPFVIGIFIYSLTISDYLAQISLFLSFGLGMGLPLLALSSLAQARQGWLARKLVQHRLWVSRTAGLLLIAAGLWGMWRSWEFVRLYL